MDANELRSFSWYRENTAAELRGCVDETFWNTALLRLTHHSKYLEHLVISMSSLDEAFRLRTDPGQKDVAQKRYCFSLWQYQKGIAGLLEDLTQPKEIPVVLASCLVCIAIELWHGDVTNAAQHVVAARRIACDLLPAHAIPGSRDSIVGTLLSCLWRYCRQLGPDVSGAAKLQLLVGSSAPAKGDCYQGRFYQLLDSYLAEVDLTPQEELMDGGNRYLNRLSHWYEHAFENEKKARQTREHHLIAAHYHAIRAMLLAMITDDEMQYDARSEDFRQILAHCSSFLKLDYTSSSESGFQIRKAPDSNFNMALSLVATKCRHPYMRRQAIRLLYQARRLEGIWSSTMMGAFAELLMRLEEDPDQSLGEPPATIVPAQRRLALHSFQYDPGILARANDSSVPPTWVQDPPHVRLGYRGSHRGVSALQNNVLYLKPYASTGEFGMKSVFWWPHINSTILKEEVSEASKSLDGPHMGYHPFHGSVNVDLRSVLYMRFMYISIESPGSGEG